MASLSSCRSLMGCSLSATHSDQSALLPTPIKAKHDSTSTQMKGDSEGVVDVERIRALFKDYMATEERIQALELPNPLTIFYVKKSQLDQIESKIQEQLHKIQTLQRRNLSLESETPTPQASSTSSHMKSIGVLRKRPPSVHIFLQNVGDKKFSAEEHEMLTSTNVLEIAQTELEMLQQEKVLHGNDVAQLFLAMSQLDKEYKKQDQILEKLGISEDETNGSSEEELLVDLESNRITISETYERWKEARSQLFQTAAQLSMVLTNMEEASRFSTADRPEQSSNNRGSYEIGEEIRDRLVSISQGLHSVKFLTLGAQLPYCTDAELRTLQKAMTYLFIDLRTDDRRQHATECYAAIQKRTLALLIWIHRTIESVIEPALESITSEIHLKVKALSQVRVNNICKTLEWKQVPLVRRSDSNSLGKEASTEGHEMQDHLDAVSNEMLHTFKYSYLAKLPSREKVFGESEQSSPSDTCMKRQDVESQKARILSAKGRTARLTRTASIDNLAQLLVNIERPNPT